MNEEQKLLAEYTRLAYRYHGKDTAKQIAILELAEKHFPPSYDTFMELAFCYERIKPDKYLVLLMRAKEKDATHDVLTYIAEFYNYAVKDALNASIYYKLALDLDPNDYWVWSDYYDCMYRHISKIEAECFLFHYADEIKETSDTSKLITIYLELSQIHRALKNPHKQLEYLHMVLEKSPNHLICILDIATTYKNLKNKGQAIKYFEKALEIEHDDELTRDALRSLHIEDVPNLKLIKKGNH